MTAEHPVVVEVPHNARVDFAKWMVDRGNFMTAEEVVDFFEKPWKWEEEYLTYLTISADAE